MSEVRKVDALRRRMLGIGKQLIAEISREAGYRRRRSKSTDADVLISWCQCHFRIERLAAEYVEAIAAYRTAMSETIPKSAARRTKQARTQALAASRELLGSK